MIFMEYKNNIAILITGVIFMALSLFGCSGNVQYERYASKNPQAGFTIDYISGWAAYEQLGSLNSFFQVVFCEPVIKGKSIRGTMVVTVINASKARFTPLTIDGMADDLIKKRTLFDSAKVLSETKYKLFDVDTRDINLSYRTMDMPRNPAGKLVPYRERIIIFRKGEKFYKIRYANFSEDFNTYAGAFDHFVKSMKFKDDK